MNARKSPGWQPLLFLPLLAVLFSGSAVAAARGERPPNFILINCDDLGFGDIGPYGSWRIKTPNLDRMAVEGMKFLDFHVTSGVCTPSRASLMTGCYPKRVGMHQNEKGDWVLFPGNAQGLNPSEVTVAEVLKQRHYATMIVGKWHLGDQPAFLPTRQGFDDYFGIPFSNDMGQTTERGPTRDRLAPTPLLRREKLIEREPDQAQLTWRYTEESLAFIERNRSKPFFLYLAHSMPHWPQHASAGFKGHSAQGRYGDAVEEIDWSTGQLLNKLKESGLENNTLVIFTSDNGGPVQQGATNLPLRAGKGTTWEGGFRVPCIARWPGKIPAGVLCHELATTMDVLPTFAQLAGAKLPSDRIIDGHDIWPLLSAQPGARTPYEAFFYYHLGQLQAVRSGDWKLIVPHSARPKQSKPEETVEVKQQLYNLADDLGEKKNVVAAHPDIVQRLTALAERGKQDLGDDSLNIPGRNCRPPGRVANPKPLTIKPPE